MDFLKIEYHHLFLDSRYEIILICIKSKTFHLNIIDYCKYRKNSMGVNANYILILITSYFNGKPFHEILDDIWKISHQKYK